MEKEQTMSIRKGDQVFIRPEWQDDGDADQTWIAVDDAEKGRVTITPITSPLLIKPTYVVTLEMLEG